MQIVLVCIMRSALCRLMVYFFLHSQKHPNAGIIIELKYAQTFQGLSKACENAMRQIRERRYDERLRNEGRNDILAYGIAFCKKKCKVVVERL